MKAKWGAESAKRHKGTASVGRAFARALSREIIGAATISYAEVVRSLRNLESCYLRQTEGHPELALEIRRRIAEQQLEQALFHDCKHSVCRARLNAASLLGFTNVERQAH